MEGIPFTDLSGFLMWVRSPAGLVILGSTVAIYFRNSEWFEDLSAKAKSTIIILTTVVILPVVFIYIPSKLPVGVLGAVDELFSVLILGGTAYLSSQLLHETLNQKVLKRKKEEADAALPVEWMVKELSGEE